MMAERGIFVDHTTLHRWVIRLLPLLDKVFADISAVDWQLRIDKTPIKVKVQRKYLYRTVGSVGQTIDFLLNRT